MSKFKHELCTPCERGHNSQNPGIFVLGLPNKCLYLTHKLTNFNASLLYKTITAWPGHPCKKCCHFHYHCNPPKNSCFVLILDSVKGPGTAELPLIYYIQYKHLCSRNVNVAYISPAAPRKIRLLT